ncbi:MAG: inositol monophosphatase family protein [Candidatus Paceibacterota bacterium]
MIPININGPIVGILLKELVRRAMGEIRRQRFVFDATVKQGYGGDMNDVFTSADTAAQQIFEGSIKETLPGVGIIGEEGLNYPCSLLGVDIYITIDPLDGTKAFVRRQSHGVATMLALVIDGVIVSVWIGDVNTMEIYGYRPGSHKVHRISEYAVAEDLTKIDRSGTPPKQHLLLRESVDSFPLPVQATIRRYHKHSIDGGSIGTWFARLWKGECGAVLMSPGHDTPWDTTPFLGISKKLGFVFLGFQNGAWELYDPPVTKTVEVRKFEVLVVHESAVGEFL